MCKFDPFDLNRDGVVDGIDALIFDEFFGDDDDEEDEEEEKRKDW